MEWYNILISIFSLLGIPSIVFALIRKLIKRLVATEKGVQAMLRAQMINEYNKALERGYAPIYAKDNFENMWKNYHNLGANGVMDDVREKYMDLPSRQEDISNEK